MMKIATVNDYIRNRSTAPTLRARIRIRYMGTVIFQNSVDHGSKSRVGQCVGHTEVEDRLNDIIVLNEMNGNQSAAARRLGIGRSTLWRYLKQAVRVKEEWIRNVQN